MRIASAPAPITQLAGRKYPSRASDAQGDVDRDDVPSRSPLILGVRPD